MTITQQFEMAWSGGQDADAEPLELLPVRLARAAATVFGVDGAGISVLTPGEFRVPLGASDDTANAAERLQFTHGVGPCLEAVGTATVVRATLSDLEHRWPTLHSELRARTPYRAVVSVPLRFGPTATPNGALDLYLADGRADTLVDADLAAVGAELVRALASRSAYGEDLPVPGPRWLHGPASRRRTQVWVALGVLNAALGLPAPDALARLRSYAYAHDTTVDDVAEALVTRTTDATELQL